MTSASSGSGMDDSLAELLNHLSGPRSGSSTSRPSQQNSAFINAPPPQSTQSKKEKNKTVSYTKLSKTCNLHEFKQELAVQSNADNIALL